CPDGAGLCLRRRPGGGRGPLRRAAIRRAQAAAGDGRLKHRWRDAATDKVRRVVVEPIRELAELRLASRAGHELVGAGAEAEPLARVGVASRLARLCCLPLGASWLLAS